MGKTAILMVFGIAVMFALVLPNIHRLAWDAVTNYTDYVKATRRHNIALSGANMAANQFFLNPAWRAGYSNVAFDSGRFDVTLQDVGVFNRVKLTSIGQYEGTNDTVIVLFQPPSFAQYAYYSAQENGIFWITGDVVNGPFHTQDALSINGAPVFNGRTTTLLGNAATSGAIFNGGYQTGVDIPLPLNLSPTLATARSGGRIFNSVDVWVTLSGSTVSWRTGSVGASSPTSATTTQSLSLFAPNGVVADSGGNIHVQGTLQGQLTLCAQQGSSSSSSRGNIYLDGDVLYQSDPRSIPSSTDMLGLVADNDVVVTDNAANSNNCVIMGSIFSRTDGLTAQNYNSGSPRGTLTMLGGITQFQRGAVGTFNTGTGAIVTGYRKDYIYDTRLLTTSPPGYPLQGTFAIISWSE
jgi:hypothetical protein